MDATHKARRLPAWAGELAALVVGALLVLGIAYALKGTPPRAVTVDAMAAVAEEWRTDPAPEGQAVIGLWADTLYPRAHVAVMVGGRAYEYGPESAPVRLLETSAPTMWRRLP